MATAKINPAFTSISGRMGNAVFYCRNNRQCIRMYVVPANPDTESQRLVRRAFTSAVKAWQQMTMDGKYAYTRKARRTGMSGYNLFISFFLTGKMNRLPVYNSVPGKDIFTGSCKYINRIRSVSKPFIKHYYDKMDIIYQDTC
ncbi:MAG: hypothetical protein JW864_11670 [Spirochaetes bacterium]|nr:hypothetical protein [Spirochaetota bacterium]